MQILTGVRDIELLFVHLELNILGKNDGSSKIFLFVFLKWKKIQRKRQRENETFTYCQLPKDPHWSEDSNYIFYVKNFFNFSFLWKAITEISYMQLWYTSIPHFIIKGIYIYI